MARISAQDQHRGMRSLIVLSCLVFAIVGCAGGYAPVGPPGATDVGFLGCQVGPQPGATVRTGDPLAAGEPLFGSGIEAMSPRQAGDTVRARGSAVTWRYMYEVGGPGLGGFSECWCEPPPDGTISAVAYGMASEIVLFVDAGQPFATIREQPPRGWGC